MARYWLVPSAEGERASYNMPTDQRDCMLAALRQQLRAELKALTK